MTNVISSFIQPSTMKTTTGINNNNNNNNNINNNDNNNSSFTLEQCNNNNNNNWSVTSTFGSTSTNSSNESICDNNDSNNNNSSNFNNDIHCYYYSSQQQQQQQQRRRQQQEEDQKQNESSTTSFSETNKQQQSTTSSNNTSDDNKSRNNDSDVASTKEKKIHSPFFERLPSPSCTTTILNNGINEKTPLVVIKDNIEEGSSPLIAKSSDDNNNNHIVDDNGGSSASSIKCKICNNNNNNNDHNSIRKIPNYQFGHGKKQHLGKHRQYWRDIILGVNDGIVSTFLLIVGVVGGGMVSTNDILLTGISGAIAGSISMFAGEFVATKSQDEVIRGEINLELHHIRHHIDDEIQELHYELFDLIGINENEQSIRQMLSEYYISNPIALHKIMIALEFGVIEEERRIPWKAGLTSCILFFIGSMPSVIPFAFVTNPKEGLFIATILTCVTLLIVGGIKTWASRGKCISSSIENLLIATLGGGFAFIVGIIFDMIVREQKRQIQEGG